MRCNVHRMSHLTTMDELDTKNGWQLATQHSMVYQVSRQSDCKDDFIFQQHSLGQGANSDRGWCRESFVERNQDWLLRSVSVTSNFPCIHRSYCVTGFRLSENGLELIALVLSTRCHLLYHFIHKDMCALEHHMSLPKVFIHFLSFIAIPM